jgi:replicative DNA helicase
MTTILHKTEAEHAVIGALLNDNAAIDNIPELRTEHFFMVKNRTVFSTVRELIEARKGADVLTVYAAMQSDGTATNGDLAYLTDLFNGIGSASNIRRYAEIVIDQFRLRGMQDAARQMLSAVESPNGRTADALIDEAASKLEALADTSGAFELTTPHDDLFGILTELGNPEPDTGFSTGLDDLDARLGGGILPGTLTIIGARPSMGKSVLGMTIARSVAAERGALFVSLEMTKRELHHRNLAALGSAPLRKFRDRPQDDIEFWNRVTAATEKYSALKLLTLAKGGLSLMDIRSAARQAKRHFGGDLAVVVVDYIGLMRAEGATRAEAIGSISRGLKSLALEMNVAIVALAQLNRESEKDRRLPGLSDLRDSGEVEQDADSVLMLHREQMRNPDAGAQWDGHALVVCAKNRNGETGHVDLRYHGECVKFSAWSGPSPRHDEQRSAPVKAFSFGK